MESFAKLVTALATFAAAVAWPAAFLASILTFRKEIRSSLVKLPTVIDRVKALKLGAIEAELERVADESARQAKSDKGFVSRAEVAASARIKADADNVGITNLLTQVDKLCIEYDTVRRVMPPSDRRTRAMTQVLVQMRTLGPSVSEHIEVYKSSGSAGSRLAAVAMMQMQPERVDLEWLARRFREEHPFIFYHAALALQNAANNGDPERLSAVKATAAGALGVVRSFDGEPDASSIQVLEAILADRDSGHYV